MITTTILPELGENCKEMVLGQLQCRVINTLFDAKLWAEIGNVQHTIVENYSFENIKIQPNIAVTRKVYKACGKDPNRYRPSAESLYRRIVKGNDLYQISTLVDLINLFSLQSGYSIGGFDADIIRGSLTAGVGEMGESYEGIGRGKLNIESLPVIRDEIGGIGTPTSDEVRTAIRLETTHFFMNVNAYRGKEGLNEFMEESIKLLQQFVNATDIQIQMVQY